MLLVCWIGALGTSHLSPVAAANVDREKRWPVRSINIVICDGQHSSGVKELCEPRMTTKKTSLALLDDHEATTIRNALHIWNAKFIQNIELREVYRPTRGAIIVFRTNSRQGRCSTKRVGYSPTKPINYISIGSKCNISRDDNRTSEGVVMHEILHALGFYHEQERPDRAKFLSLQESRVVRVAWGLDCRRKIKNCAKGKRGVPSGRYDFASIMHYSRDGKRADGSRLTRKGNAKLDRMNTSAQQIGQREGLSSGDIYAVNTLYPTQ